jgi:hypothetical protein
MRKWKFEPSLIACRHSSVQIRGLIGEGKSVYAFRIYAISHDGADSEYELSAILCHRDTLLCLHLGLLKMCIKARYSIHSACSEMRLSDNEALHGFFIVF